MSFGLVGISTAETGRYSAFYASLSTLVHPAGTRSAFCSGAVISENRNTITKAAIDTGADWVLYLDDDHILQPDTLTRLLKADKDVISAHYIRRQPPFGPVILDELSNGNFMWKQLSSEDHGIIQADAVGAGCLLVRRNVLKALEPPYWTLGQINPASWGDDMDFCRRVRKAGFPIHCDLDNTIAHMMTGIVWPSRDANIGWAANFAKDYVTQDVLVQWPMPLKGDI